MSDSVIENKEMRYESLNHSKTRLRYHIIFSTKYRNNCLSEIREEVLESFRYAESKSHFKILTMEIDRNHIHLLLKIPPKYSVEQTVRRMKQMTTIYLYSMIDTCVYLKRYYWKNKFVLWTHGYFCSTIGEVSESTLKHYIENQG